MRPGRAQRASRAAKSAATLTEAKARLLAPVASAWKPSASPWYVALPLVGTARTGVGAPALNAPIRPLSASSTVSHTPKVW